MVGASIDPLHDMMALLVCGDDASANGVLLEGEGYFLIETIRGRASLYFYLGYRGRYIEQAAQIL